MYSCSLKDYYSFTISKSSTELTYSHAEGGHRKSIQIKDLSEKGLFLNTLLKKLFMMHTKK